MTYNRKDLAVQVNIKSIKGYTMKEIGALEDRIRRLEYYTVLNALELDTKTLSVRDPNTNLERFKNGIFADPFNDHTLGKTEDSEYNIAMSPSKSIARPTFSQIFGDFRLNTASSTNIRTAGQIAMIDWTDEKFASNPYATIYRNCTESFYSWKGYCQLFPNIDNSVQSTQAAPQNVTVDIAGAFSAFAAAGGAQNIDTVVGGISQTGSQSTTDAAGAQTVTNYFSQSITQTITDISVNVQRLNQDLGNFITDVSILPYMRGRMIAVVARGMRPGIQVYPFFDNQAVSMHVAPARVNPAYADANGKVDQVKIRSLSGGRENEVLQPNGRRGDPIYTNSEGEAYVIFYLPDGTFRAGDRTFLLTNVDNVFATGAILTTAEGVYSSSSLGVTQTNVSFSILQPQFTPVSISTQSVSTFSSTTVFNPPPQQIINITNVTNNTTVVNETPWAPANGGGDGGGDGGGGGGNDPVGQSFLIPVDQASAVPGVYLTQIGVFFKKKSTNLGITCVIAQMNAGLIDSTRILGRAHLNSSQVSVSNDSSSETIFTFDSPVLLQSDTQFAFYLVPDADNPDYEIWISEVGGTDILTNQAITSQPYSGTMFVSSNGRTWSAVQSSDIKFNLYRARFLYNTATAVFQNERDDYLTITGLLRANTDNPIALGDVVYSANAANINQPLTNTASKPFGVVQYVDELNGILYLDSSNGLFNNSNFRYIRIYRVPDITDPAQVVNTNLIATGTISTVEDLPYHGIVPKFTFLEPAGTIMSTSFSGTSNATNSFAKDGDYLSVKNETLYEFTDYERVLRSYSNEVATGGYTDGTTTLSVNMASANPYLSPVINLSSKTFNFIRNRINNDASNENTRYGNALNKYISKNVVLDQEAEDLIVYVTAYRPAGTNVLVYGKFLNETDQELFDIKEWTLLSESTNYIFSSTGDTEDYKELIFNVPTTGTAGQKTAWLDANAPSPYPAGCITYYDSTGTIPYLGYKTFNLKIVLLSTDPVRIPTLRDVRALALQK